MNSQKKVKGHSKVIKDLSHVKEKGMPIFYKHHTQSVHIRSVSKDVKLKILRPLRRKILSHCTSPRRLLSRVAKRKPKKNI